MRARISEAVPSLESRVVSFGISFFLSYRELQQGMPTEITRDFYSEIRRCHEVREDIFRWPRDSTFQSEKVRKSRKRVLRETLTLTWKKREMLFAACWDQSQMRLSHSEKPRRHLGFKTRQTERTDCLPRQDWLAWRKEGLSLRGSRSPPIDRKNSPSSSTHTHNTHNARTHKG